MNVGIVQKQVDALAIREPGDMVQGKLPFQGGKERCRPQDISLSAALDDQNSGGKRCKLRTAPAVSLINAGLVPPEMDAFGPKPHRRSLLARVSRPIYAIRQSQ